jgi:hypothetical protein
MSGGCRRAWLDSGRRFSEGGEETKAERRRKRRLSLRWRWRGGKWAGMSPLLCGSPRLEGNAPNMENGERFIVAACTLLFLILDQAWLEHL